MTLADEIIGLQFGTPKLEQLRAAATRGEQDALRAYVYFCAWQGIRSDKSIPHKEKAALFREFVDLNSIEVALVNPIG